MAYKRKSTKRPARKYSRKPKGTALSRLARQVKMMAIQNKPEKKYMDVGSDYVTSFGQYNGTGVDGALVAGLNPIPATGTGTDQRIGSKIQLCSAYLQIQIKQQSQCKSPVRYRYWVVRRLQNNPSDTPPNTAYGDMFSLNPFSGVRDYFSNKNILNINAYKTIARGQGIIKGDETSSQQQIGFVKRGLKLDFPHVYAVGTSTHSEINKMYLFIQCDNGDIINPTYTGLQAEWTCRFFWTDC